MLVTANASDLPTLTDMTPIHLTGFEAHVIAGALSLGGIPSSATWAEDRRARCTSPGRWGGNCVKALGFAIGDRGDGGRQGGNPAQQDPETQHHLPQNSSTTFFFRSNSFPSFLLVQPPTRAALPRTERAQQSWPDQCQPMRHGMAWHGTAWHSTALTGPAPTVCKPSQNLP